VANVCVVLGGYPAVRLDSDAGGYVNPFPKFPQRFVVGDKVWLHGEPVTVISVMGDRAHIVPGHHSWTGCRVDDLSHQTWFSADFCGGNAALKKIVGVFQKNRF